jgi:exodeoxyribonuclease VII small subunit
MRPGISIGKMRSRSSFTTVVSLRRLPQRQKMKASSSKKAERPRDGESFERSLKRLEEIVETLERGGVSLDEIMKIYEEGVQISKRCLEQLAEAELKLKRLTKDAQGNFDLVDEDDEK